MYIYWLNVNKKRFRDLLDKTDRRQNIQTRGLKEPLGERLKVVEIRKFRWLRDFSSSSRWTRSRHTTTSTTDLTLWVLFGSRLETAYDSTTTINTYVDDPGEYMTGVQ